MTRMIGEISRDYYCSADSYDNTGGCIFYTSSGHKCDDRLRKICGAYHRKYPTPEQFKKEEYGEEWTGAVYYQVGFENDEITDEWFIGSLDDAYKEFKSDSYTWLLTICACTPWSEPPQGWWPV